MECVLTLFAGGCEEGEIISCIQLSCCQETNMFTAWVYTFSLQLL